MPPLSSRVISTDSSASGNPDKPRRTLYASGGSAFPFWSFHFLSLLFSPLLTAQATTTDTEHKRRKHFPFIALSFSVNVVFTFILKPLFPFHFFFTQNCLFYIFNFLNSTLVEVLPRDPLPPPLVESEDHPAAPRLLYNLRPQQS